MALALVAASCHGGAATVPHADAAVLDAAPSRIATDTARPLTDVVESGLIVDAAASEDASDGEDADLLGPRLFIMKDWYDFTPIGGAQPSPYLVDVVNAGEAGTGPVTVAMLGPDAARFIIMQNTCSVLAAHARCAIVVAFEPGGTVTGTVRAIAVSP